MTANPPVLHREDTVKDALDLLLKHRYLALPVVDDNRRYLGMFAKSRLFGLLLPSVVAGEGKLPERGQLPNLAFMDDHVADLRSRFDTVGEQRVGEYADQTVPKIAPDASLMEAVLIVFRTRNFVPVVDPVTNRLEGVLSTWDILSKIRERN